MLSPLEIRPEETRPARFAIDSRKDFRHIVLCTALSPCDETLLLLVRQLALKGSFSQLTLLHACAQTNQSAQQHEEQLHQMIEGLRSWGISASSCLIHGEPSSVILNFIRRNRVDLLLLGRQRSRLLERVHSCSIVESVLRSCVCPVLNAGPNVRTESLEHLDGPVIFATDFNDAAEDVVQLAALYARQRDARLHCIHVIPPVGKTSDSATVRSIMSNTLNQLAVRSCTDQQEFSTGILQGVDVCQSIVQYAVTNSAQAIVLAIQDAHGWSHFFAPDLTHQVISAAPCPVITLSSQKLREL